LAERGLEVDASCVWRWVQVYSSELNKRCQPHLKRTNKSYRVDETYIKVKGQDKYLYRAVDSTGQSIDFLLAAKRDTAAAKRFFEKVFSSSSNRIPRVINVDKNPAYPAAVEALKAEGTLPAEFFCASASISTMSSNRIIEPSKSGPGWQRATAPFKVPGELSRVSKR
jgi:transposase, IS6 family